MQKGSSTVKTSMEKFCVPNHNLPSVVAKQLTRCVEKRVRRAGKKACKEDF